MVRRVQAFAFGTADVSAPGCDEVVPGPHVPRTDCAFSEERCEEPGDEGAITTDEGSASDESERCEERSDEGAII